MKKIMAPFIAIMILSAFSHFADSFRPSAQQLPKPPQENKQESKKVIPEVIMLGKDSKIGAVTFNHVKHNGGEYNIGGPILCIECHHTAQPASEVAKIPSHKTVWPVGRTTTLTADLFAQDPAKAGVAACRDCHARDGSKPNLIDAMPSIQDPETKEVIKITNQRAFHTACDVCHFQIQFRTTGSKVPNATNCTTCHKSTSS
jgi:cytochrome c553